MIAHQKASSAEIAETVRGAIAEFRDGRPQDDDLTLISVKVPGQAHGNKDN
ncbi:MAG: hypothetical protein WD733_25685 [Bryobacterales bacterium]